MINILALSFFPAFLPPRSGGEARLFGIYEALSKNHRVTLITSGFAGEEVVRLEHNAYFTEIRVPKEDSFAEEWNRLSAGAGGGDLSAPAIAGASKVPGNLHRSYLEIYPSADIIIHDSPFLVGTDLLIGIDSKPRIYNSYNVEADIYRELHKERSTDDILSNVIEAERIICTHADLITVCTGSDGDRLRELYQYKGPICLVPNGVDKLAPPPEREAGGKKLVFIGSEHRPNQTAVQKILAEIAPAMSDYEFHLIGKCCPAGNPLPNVTAHGMVSDSIKASLFSSAIAALNPMEEGGGSSLKVADIAMAGLPLISTAKGARGFGFVPGRHYAELDPNAPIESILRVLNDKNKLKEIGVAAHSHISTNFTWGSIGHTMAGCIKKTIDLVKSKVRESRYLVLNDYDPFSSVGGGATRIRGLYEGVSESAQVVILCFAEGRFLQRTEVFSGKGIVIGIPKDACHQIADRKQAEIHHVSIIDILSTDYVVQNDIFLNSFKLLQNECDLVICEHPYLASLPRTTGCAFVYSSQNYESGLKSEILEGHPYIDELRRRTTDIERFAVGCSDLIIAVSEQDAVAIGANFDIVAPIVIVPNGAEEPAKTKASCNPLPGLNACFLGSAHLPNVAAAKFIVDELAPELPHVTFHLAGSVCDCLPVSSANVKKWGILGNQDKTVFFSQMQIALNPITTGSGSNVKVADYLKNGLPVLTTAFGARGYEYLPASDLIIQDLQGFYDYLSDNISRQFQPSEIFERRERYLNELSMVTHGRNFAELLSSKLKRRPRALFVTYRYNLPALGGAEHYASKMIKYLADDGFDIDVISPKVKEIKDHNRFTSEFPMDVLPGPIPIGNPFIRSAKFPLAEPIKPTGAVENIWHRQPHFEKELYTRSRHLSPIRGLGWGWCPIEGHGRWVLTSFGIATPENGLCQIAGSAPFNCMLRIQASDGSVLFQRTLEGDFQIEFYISITGIVDAYLYYISGERPCDPRPLGLFITSILLNNQDFTYQRPFSPWQTDEKPVKIFHEMHRAAQLHREAPACNLTAVRGPHSPMLVDFLYENAADYDLIISHNSVFRTAIDAIDAAASVGVPSIFLPHAHFDDDYYHFPDALDAVKKATLSLVSPRSACSFLNDLGLTNVIYHSPGVDLVETPSGADRAAFRQHLTSSGPFALILGRKAQAKCYEDVIDAVRELRQAGYPSLHVVMIGPDDDKRSISNEFVTYLGIVERNVLRGALAESTLVVNMSQSESFGMVVLEAALAGRPVVVNANCAAFHDLVVDGETGLLANRNTLASAIKRILNDPDGTARMVLAAKKAAMEYGWDVQGAAFIQACRGLLKKDQEFA